MLQRNGFEGSLSGFNHARAPKYVSGGITPSITPSCTSDEHVPEAETPSRSAVQRGVANALGLPPDDEELNSVDQMLKDNSAQTPIAWIRGCAKNGDLGRLLNAAHAARWATQ